ncbi:hypothetical protein BC830DRAFT_632675 [Chytriomyces sp. MP71]|nr:hypothetical protein BC830DRAFT_632675 [Chytriomyces sp. MP71]
MHKYRYCTLCSLSFCCDRKVDGAQECPQPHSIGYFTDVSNTAICVLQQHSLKITSIFFWLGDLCRGDSLSFLTTLIQDGHATTIAPIADRVIYVNCPCVLFHAASQTKRQKYIHETGLSWIFCNFRNFNGGVPSFDTSWHPAKKFLSLLGPLLTL